MGSGSAGSARRSAGFTLVEVLVAVAILGLAVVGWLAAYGSELRALTRASEVTTATTLAEERLATLRLFSEEGLASLPDSLEEGTFPEPLERYRWEADVRAVSGRSLAELTVTVTWDSGARVIATRVPVRPVSSFGSIR